jgi:uncharacterized protein YggT (Ycf19 family)
MEIYCMYLYSTCIIIRWPQDKNSKWMEHTFYDITEILLKVALNTIPLIFLDLQLLIAPLVSSYFSSTVLIYCMYLYSTCIIIRWPQDKNSKWMEHTFCPKTFYMRHMVSSNTTIHPRILSWILYTLSNTHLWNMQIMLSFFNVMCNLWHDFKLVERGQYLPL